MLQFLFPMCMLHITVWKCNLEIRLNSTNGSKTYWPCMDVLIIHHILVVVLLEIQGNKLMLGIVHNKLDKKVWHCSSNSVVDDGVVNRHELACSKVLKNFYKQTSVKSDPGIDSVMEKRLANTCEYLNALLSSTPSEKGSHRMKTSSTITSDLVDVLVEALSYH